MFPYLLPRYHSVSLTPRAGTLPPLRRSPPLLRAFHTPPRVVTLPPLIRAFHTSPNFPHRLKSTYRRQLRPDLKENDEILKKINKDENPELWKQKFNENCMWWKTADPDALAKKLSHIMATISYKTPNGGFRIGIIKILLIIATSPNHLRVAQQALTIMQNKDVSRVFHQNYSVLMSVAAVRIRAPEIGLSFLRMPWLNMWPTERSVQLLVEYYAKDAEELFLDHISVGEPPALPQLIKEEIEGEEEEEEKEKDKEAIAKAEAKTLDTWLSGFTEAYKELRSDRHRWRPSVLSLSMAIRFYAAVGDVNAAIQLLEAIKEPVPNLALRNIMLALVYQGRATEALKYKPLEHPGPALPAVLAVHLALQDYSSVLAIIKGEQALTIDMCKIHFGVPDRIKALRTILQTIQAEGSPQVTIEAQQYIESLPQTTEPQATEEPQMTEPQATEEAQTTEPQATEEAQITGSQTTEPQVTEEAQITGSQNTESTVVKEDLERVEGKK